MSDFVWHWPQVTYAILLGWHVVRTLEHFGEPKKPDRWDSTDLLACGIIALLLYCGGFWTGPP